MKEIKNFEKIKELLDQYFDLINVRLNYFKGFTSFGEDSIRYDFFHTLMKKFNLEPHQVILEQAIPNTQFRPKSRSMEHKKQGRNLDKPEFDLRVDPFDVLDFGIIGEFAYFRKPDIGTLDVSGSYGKILNEIHRLALLKHFQNVPKIEGYLNFNEYRCLLICVTDSVMLRYGKGSRGRKPAQLVQDEFILDDQFLATLTNVIKDKVDEKFKDRVDELGIIPIAKRVYNRVDQFDNPAWGIWVWEVSFKR